MANYEEFRKHGKEMVDYICDYMKSMDKMPVGPDFKPGFLAPLLAGEMPNKPEPYSEVIDDFEKKIMPGVLHWNHSNFFAYFGSGNSYPSLLGEMLSAGMGSLGFSWASCPSITELEGVMLDWYAKALNLPDFFLSKASNPKSIGGGSLQSSASDAIFACMMSARARAIKQLKGEDEDTHDSVFLPKLVCYTSSEAHSCVEKAAIMNLVQIRLIKPDENDSMRGDALEKAIKADEALGLVPFFVCATLGTTSQVAFDNLQEIGIVCKKFPSIWFHVDGAYGGNAFLLPEMRYLKAGMELVDSFETNPNKMLLTGFDCTCLWVKDIVKYASAFAVDPVYLQHQHETAIVDLRHCGVPLSRRFRALKLYFMFRMYGLEKLQSYVRRIIAMGQVIEKLIKADNRFEIKNEVLLGLVCFKLNGQCDAVNKELWIRLNKSSEIHLTPSIVKGEYIIRFVANQEHCNEAQIEAAWKIIQKISSELLEDLEEVQKKCPTVRLLPSNELDALTEPASMTAAEDLIDGGAATKPIVALSQSKATIKIKAAKDFKIPSYPSQKLRDGATPVIVDDPQGYLAMLKPLRLKRMAH